MHNGKRTMISKSNSCTLIIVENIKAKNLTNTLQNEESNIASQSTTPLNTMKWQNG